MILARILSFVLPDPEAACSGYHGRPRIPGIPAPIATLDAGFVFKRKK